MDSYKKFQRAVTAKTEIEELPTSPVAASPPAAAVGNDDAIYVAVGKEKKDAETTLSWALHNSGGKKIFVLHVHSPSQRISMMGAYVPISRLEEHRVRAYHDSERQDTHKLLEKYISMCRKAGVRAEKLYIETDSIEKGILELILLNDIKRLVMGAAANKHYSKKMMVPRSTMANYVRLNAPAFCHIWFVCKGHLIHTREASSNGVNAKVISPVVQAHPIPGTDVLPRSFSETQSSQVESSGSVLEHRRRRSDNPPCLSFSSESTGGETPEIRERDYMPDDTRGETPQNRITVSIPSNIGDETPQSRMRVSVCESFEGETPQSTISVEGSPDIWGSVARRSYSGDSHFSSCSSSEMGDDSASVSAAGMDENGSELVLQTPRHPMERHFYESPSQRVIEGSVRDELYDRLQEYVQETENSRRAAYEESIRRRKAESDALEARRRAKASEAMLSEELRRRKEIEDLLEIGKEEVERMKLQLEEVRRNLQLALDEKSSLDSQIENSEKVIKDLEEKMFLSVELLQKYKSERDELQLERDNALWEAEELRKSQSEETTSVPTMPYFFSEYLLTEIEEATHNFDPAMKIGQGGYGSIYKGLLHHTQVAIKVLDSCSSQGPLEFRQEVNILSNMRHPNLVNLLGVCHEAWALIYEYLPNGSLEDRLSCKDNSQPLSWQSRIRIAAELCSVLIFLHNCRPQGIVHGDLKPANLLLDANYVSKLSDFGICRIIYDNGTTGNNTTVCYRTDPKGTFAYMDPEFLATGELTTKSDVYSFGIILLRLLTGKSALGIRKEVQSALDKENLKGILDPTAGDWPFVRAKQLTHLALSCCELSRKNRPDLALEVWRVLEPMRVSCGASPSRLNSEKRSHVPSYFICPVFQEMMRDPMVAADGYTYEAEAMRGWLDSGNDTSPMTNHKLSHSNLVPNRALRSAIQEWLQQQQH